MLDWTYPENNIKIKPNDDHLQDDLDKIDVKTNEAISEYVDNSVAAAKKTGREINVKIEFEIDEEHVTIIIKDQSGGIKDFDQCFSHGTTEDECDLHAFGWGIKHALRQATNWKIITKCNGFFYEITKAGHDFKNLEAVPVDCPDPFIADGGTIIYHTEKLRLVLNDFQCDLRYPKAKSLSYGLQTWLSVIYAKIIKSKGIFHVHEDKCYPVELEFDKLIGSKKIETFETDINGKIYQHNFRAGRLDQINQEEAEKRGYDNAHLYPVHAWIKSDYKQNGAHFYYHGKHICNICVDDMFPKKILPKGHAHYGYQRMHCEVVLDEKLPARITFNMVKTSFQKNSKTLEQILDWIISRSDKTDEEGYNPMNVEDNGGQSHVLYLEKVKSFYEQSYTEAEVVFSTQKNFKPWNIEPFNIDAQVDLIVYLPDKIKVCEVHTKEERGLPSGSKIAQLAMYKAGIERNNDARFDGKIIEYIIYAPAFTAGAKKLAEEVYGFTCKPIPTL